MINPSAGTYIMAWMTTYNGDPLSFGPVQYGRLEDLRDADKWPSLSLVFHLGNVKGHSWGLTSSLTDRARNSHRGDTL